MAGLPRSWGALARFNRPFAKLGYTYWTDTGSAPWWRETACKAPPEFTELENDKPDRVSEPLPPAWAAGQPPGAPRDTDNTRPHVPGWPTLERKHLEAWNWTLG